MDIIIILAAILLLIWMPLLGFKAAGYLVLKYKFGNSFKEVHDYHKEQDRLEALHKAKDRLG